MDIKWDRRFLNLAKHVASWSKDPSTQAGAVIVDENRRVVSVGFNGFAQGVEDGTERYANRDVKYSMVVHAEMNAILFARQFLHGCTLYTWPFQPCSRCAAVIIQSGIRRCVAPEMPERLVERWHIETVLAQTQFTESGVQLSILKEVKS